MLFFHQPVPPLPTFPSQTVMANRLRFAASELCELADAMGFAIRMDSSRIDDRNDSHIQIFASGNHRPDMVKIYDALIDIQVFNDGTAIAFGLDIEPGFSVVHQNNMNKLWEEHELARVPDGWTKYRAQCADGVIRYVVHDEGGKVRKPPEHPEPDLVSVLDAHFYFQQPANSVDEKSAERPPDER